LTSALAAAVLLAACGGGGGSPGATPSPQPNPTPNPNPAPCKVQVVADASVEQNKTASATVLPCDQLLGDVKWTQTGGPAVNLSATRSPTVAFDASAPGTVALRADVTLADGSTTSANATVNVTASTGTSTGATSYMTVRLDHAVRPGAQTSLRAWPYISGGDTLRTISWTQVSGTPVTLDDPAGEMVTFTAPKTTTASTLKFRATMTTTGGRTDSDEVTVSIDPQAAAATAAIFDATDRVHPYRQASLYAGVLQRCAYNVELFYRDDGTNNLCPVSTLPLIQAEAGPDGIPTVEQIMGRVLVSHDFLGANFEQFLRNSDPHGDLRRMFGSVTAIVIGSHVRPSYYTPATGAIYLDAGYLWLRAEERDVVTEVPDYRLAFAKQVNFETLGRMVRFNDYARYGSHPWDRAARSTDELVFGLGRLLYHELAHAADYIPPAQRALDPSRSIWGNVGGRVTDRTLPSDLPAQQYPLRSAEMKGLGQVLYMGATATATQKAYTATQVGAFFASDVASDDYAYSIFEDSNSREDLAMLFEEFMMGYRHNTRYDVAYTDRYPDDADTDAMIVRWGQRGRIAEAAIKPRVKLVLQRVAPWIPVSAVDSLPAPVLMTPGTTWAQNLAISPAGAMSGVSRRVVESKASRRERQHDDRFGRHVH
jgi:hypothetical protein